MSTTLRARKLWLLVPAVAAAVAAGNGIAAAADGAVDRPTSVVVMRAVMTGGHAPSTDRIGAISRSSGNLLDRAYRPVGKWSYRCTYISANRTTHQCSVTHVFKGKGTIVAEGLFFGVGPNSWLAITRGTGRFKGTFGVIRLVEITSAATPETFYLLR